MNSWTSYQLFPLVQCASASSATLLAGGPTLVLIPGFSQWLFLLPGRISLQNFAYPYIIWHLLLLLSLFLPLYLLLTFLLGILTHLLFMNMLSTNLPRPGFFQPELSSPRFLQGAHPHLFQLILCLCVYIFNEGILETLKLKVTILSPFLLFPIVFSYQVAYYIYFYFSVQNVSSVRADTLKKQIIHVLI